MGRLKSVNFSQEAIDAMDTADQASIQHVKEAIRYLCLHRTIGKSLKLQPSGLKTYRLGSFRIFHRIRNDTMDVIFLEFRRDVYR
jgi:mRNA-degrading endonuclease RelE of RelBE toxin-antitoxin system